MMRFTVLCPLTLAVILGTGGIFAQPGQTVQLQDGQVYFVAPPRLVDAVTTENRAAASRPMYYFTLSVPEDAGEPLQRVEVALRDGDTALRRISLEESRAFVGTPRDRGDELAIQDTTFDRDTQTATVTFATGVAPGTTVTIGLRPERNPRLGGVYLFGVTAFPQGESAYGQFLGYGRLHIYENNHSPFFPN